LLFFIIKWHLFARLLLQGALRMHVVKVNGLVIHHLALMKKIIRIEMEIHTGKVTMMMTVAMIMLPLLKL
jgi:hypothetical protein